MFVLVKTNVLNCKCEQNNYFACYRNKCIKTAFRLCMFHDLIDVNQITAQGKDPCLGKSIIFNHWKDKKYENAFFY